MPILGIDEVGRGPWAGPLVVGACILPPRELPDGTPDPAQAWQDQLTDSKKLTKQRREALNTEILAKATATGLGWVPAAELDQLGLSAALRLATRRAVQTVQARLRSRAAKRGQLAASPGCSGFTEIIIDGTINFLAGTHLEGYVTTLKKADLLIKEVSAASIIAKVARDQYMTNLAATYPAYGFDQHVGYGTAAHRQALQTYGPTPEHRHSFRPVATIAARDEENGRSRSFGGVRSLARRGAGSSAHGDGPDEPIAKRLASAAPAATTTIGREAESRVAAYLQAHGHTLLARNYKTKFYEIDLITSKDDKIYFTEVKYRHNSTCGTPLEAITTQKQRQMRFAAEVFLQDYADSLRPRLGSPLPATRRAPTFQPILAAAAVSGPDFHIDAWLEMC